ncbi:phosphatidate cytidylyltransferase [Halothiobacillus sp. DCM-1]|uniref:phosphatidate cytidylyltransferase n=1 Tax=Halothiobacillus sp. DCM-1 TaxID=3112558 RepID=UPI0032440F90
MIDSAHTLRPASGTRLRVQTALVLGLLGLVVLFALPGWAFTLFIGLLVLALGDEWFRLCFPRVKARVLAGLMLALLLGTVWYLPSVDLPWLLALGGVIWLGQIVDLWRHRLRASGIRSPWWRAALGLILLPIFGAAVWDIHQQPQGAWLLLFGILLVAMADSLAYFAGRAFGRHKLAPALSPAKTVEGLIGGLLGVAVLAAIGALLPWFAGVPSWQLAVASMIVGLFSVAGDLEESRLKREAGVKDSGRLLPGHGGLLDRLDGQLAAMPIWALALMSLSLWSIPG